MLYCTPLPLANHDMYSEKRYDFMAPWGKRVKVAEVVDHGSSSPKD